MIRDEIEAHLRAKLQTAPPPPAVIRFDLGADGAIVMDGRATPASVAATGPTADTTITLSASDLKDMLAGALSPMDAYASGRLDVAGDMGPAMQLSSLLG